MNMKLPFEKEYKKGSKNSTNSKNITFRMQQGDIEFLKEFHSHLVKKEGFHNLAFTRTDILHHSMDLFIDQYYTEIMNSGNKKLIETLKKRKENGKD